MKTLASYETAISQAMAGGLVIIHNGELYCSRQKHQNVPIKTRKLVNLYDKKGKRKEVWSLSCRFCGPVAQYRKVK